MNQNSKFVGFVYADSRQYLKHKVEDYRDRGYVAYGKTFKFSKEGGEHIKVIK